MNQRPALFVATILVAAVVLAALPLVLPPFYVRVGQLMIYSAGLAVAWTILGVIQPPIGHVYGYTLEPADDGATLVTSYYDWSDIHEHWREADIFPVISESALKATLGILDRTVRRGYPRA